MHRARVQKLMDSEKMSGGLYSYTDIRVLHLEPTANCQAACPMCGRNLNGGQKRENVPLDEVSLADFQQWFPADFLRQINTLYMCGNFGDPIIARDCQAMFAHARAASASLNLSMNTNGSARSPEFWQEMANLGVSIHFALDGACQETHARYRRNTRFEHILTNAEHFIKAGGYAIWDMLAFQHNQHEFEAAEKLANKLGFARFDLKSTNRFYGTGHPVHDADGKRVDTLFPSDRFPAPLLNNRPTKAQLATCEIDCKVQAEKSIYVAASGLAFPCCWLGAPVHEKEGVKDSRYAFPNMNDQLRVYQDLLNLIGEKNLNLHETPLPVVVNRYFPHFARRWAPDENRLHKCALTCGKTGIDPYTTLLVSQSDLRGDGDQRRT